jgi:acyl-CoA reductase-like NAD-dependent aldehyde dehydrogenase
MNVEVARTSRPAAGPRSAIFREEYGHFIAGEWVASTGGETIAQYNPATGQELARIQAGTPADVNRAVAAARAAFKTWSRSSAGERQDLLLEIAARLKRRHADFARMESLNNGKTLAEAMFFDIPQSWGQFELFAGAAHQLHGETRDYPNAIGLVHREALGVIAQIIPWNVPLAMAAMKLAPAIAAGNAVVLKPAESVCLSVLEFAAEIADILPKGLINIVTGYGQEIGEALVSHPDVRKVAFTGSSATGRKIVQYASRNLIPQTLELGGKSANIVCADADIEAAAQGAALSTLFNKGEVCMAGSRVFVHQAVKEEFLDRFKQALEAAQIGDPLDEATKLGAMASRAQYDKVLGYFEVARAEGAAIVTGGEAARGGALDRGWFIKPTIFDHVRNDMRVAREEIFGPVTSVLTWDDEADMLAQANDSRYGLAGAIWTRNLSRAHRITRELETGVIWVNSFYNMQPGMPVGGYKESGYGREFAWDVLRDYTITKSVIINLSG